MPAPRRPRRWSWRRCPRRTGPGLSSIPASRCQRDPAPGTIAVDMAVLLPWAKCSLTSTTRTSRPSSAARRAPARPPPAPATTRSGPPGSPLVSLTRLPRRARRAGPAGAGTGPWGRPRRCPWTGEPSSTAEHALIAKSQVEPSGVRHDGAAPGLVVGDVLERQVHHQRRLALHGVRRQAPVDLVGDCPVAGQRADGGSLCREECGREMGEAQDGPREPFGRRSLDRARSRAKTRRSPPSRWSGRPTPRRASEVRTSSSDSSDRGADVETAPRSRRMISTLAGERRS